MTQNNEKEKIKEKKTDYYWIVFLVCMFFFVGFMLYLGTLKEIAQINYLASLTSEERQEIEQNKIEEQEQKEKQSKEFWDTLFYPIQVPIMFLLLPLFLLIVNSICRFRLW